MEIENERERDLCDHGRSSSHGSSSILNWHPESRKWAELIIWYYIRIPGLLSALFLLLL